MKLKNYNQYSSKLDGYLDKNVTVLLRFITGTKFFKGKLKHSTVFSGYALETEFGSLHFKKKQCLFISLT